MGVIETPDYSEPYYTGPEIQVLDMGDPKYDPAAEKEKEYYEAGALYDLVKPSQQVAKPAGMWNHVLLHIDHNNNHGHVVLNDVKIVEFPVHGETWEKMISESKFSEWKEFGISKVGKIGLVRPWKHRLVSKHQNQRTRINHETVDPFNVIATDFMWRRLNTKEKITYGQKAIETKTVDENKTPFIDLSAVGIGPVESLTFTDYNQDLAATGKDLFGQKCTACHKTDARYIGHHSKESMTDEILLGL